MTLVSIIFPTSVLSSFPFVSSSLVSFPDRQNLFLTNQTHHLLVRRQLSSSTFSFLSDFNKKHRSAASALSEARQEARDVGIERREEMHKRVKEMAKDNEHVKEGESATQERQ